MKDLQAIEQLKEAVRQTFGRTLDAPTDFDALSADIMRRTGEGVSSSTLRRLYGYVKPAVVPRPSTLSVLARYVGRKGWSAFCDEQTLPHEEPIVSPGTQPSGRSMRWIVGLGLVAVVALVGVGWFFLHPMDKMPTADVPASDTSVVAPTTDLRAEAYQQLCDRYQHEAQEFYQRITAQRETMSILTYKELVDSAYFAFTFDYLCPRIETEVAAIYSDDQSLSTIRSEELFGRCRDICVRVIREFDHEAWGEAFRRHKGL
ncbi:MAG: hypothetical protein IKM37_08525 [Alistipes sp.]|nr:hypothetical protein [Alistipes sp.]